MLRYANVSPIVFMEKGSPFVPMATFNYGGKIKKWGKRERVFVKSSIFAAEETKQNKQDNEEVNNHETSLFPFPVATMF